MAYFPTTALKQLQKFTHCSCHIQFLHVLLKSGSCCVRKTYTSAPRLPYEVQSAQCILVDIRQIHAQWNCYDAMLR